MFRGTAALTETYRGYVPIRQIYRGTALMWSRPDSSTGTYDFASGSIPVDSRLTRSGTAYRWGEAGSLLAVSASTPRFDYADGVLRGMLVEAAATNLVSQPRLLTHASWTKTSATVTTATGADGTNGSELTASAANGRATIAATVSAATDYVFSACVKRKTGYDPVDIGFWLGSGTLGADPFTFFPDSYLVVVAHPNHGFLEGDTLTLSGATAFGGVTIAGECDIVEIIDANRYVIGFDPALGKPSAGGTGGGSSVAYLAWQLREATAHMLGGKWAQVFITRRSTSTTLTPVIRVRVSGDAVYVDGMQLELGTRPTSPMLGASRAADTLRLTNINGALGWDFAWPLPARLRNARHVKRVQVLSAGGGTANLRITYDAIGDEYESTIIGAVLS